MTRSMLIPDGGIGRASPSAWPSCCAGCTPSRPASPSHNTAVAVAGAVRAPRPGEEIVAAFFEG
jgi:hypothetical protein